MPSSPEQFLQAAQALNRLHQPLVSDEACARTMANRMYYAAYLAIREALRAQTGDRRFDVAHGALVEGLSEATDSDVRALGTHLGRLWWMRVLSDYRLDQTISKYMAALHLHDAQFVLDNAPRLSGRFPPIERRQAKRSPDGSQRTPRRPK